MGALKDNKKKRFIVPLLDQRRDADTLIPIIQKFILPKTIIISDAWRAYNKLKDYGYEHKIINHSVNFVDPADPSIHTQTIERS